MKRQDLGGSGNILWELSHYPVASCEWSAIFRCGCYSASSAPGGRDVNYYYTHLLL